ncbi:hypothetical protein MNBD_NITROSPINAE02-2242 [hydrothermal vent metagenome]|uniref:Acylneuraminate cytidylyltransferase n=1 Tax=hydrothermal vent metagenome TaxID=652676 RepID=A0A3B1CJC4_9ZZZZ
MTNSSIGDVKVQAILQARCGSTRLPGKIFKSIGDKSALGWVVARLKASRMVDRIVIATTTGKEDDRVEKYACHEGISIFRGSRDDVLGRFIETLKKFPAFAIVRATGDNPLLDVGALDHMIAEHLKNKADHTTVSGAVPIGSAAEIVSCAALRIAWENATQKPYREHVTPYIYENRGRFRVIDVKPPDYLDGRNYRFTLDTGEDLRLLISVYKRLAEEKKPFDAKEATRLADVDPGIMEINRDVEMKTWSEE